MDIIHGLSNLEIETTDSSSSQEVEEVEMRNWVELPTDVMSIILLKLGHVDILVSAQWVCTSWWKLSKQPHLFRCIQVEDYVTKEHSVWLDPTSLKEPREMGREVIDGSCSQLVECLVRTTSNDGVLITREAIDRSCGQLLKISVKAMASNGLLLYMSKKSSSLRCLRVLANYYKSYYKSSVTDDGLIETAKKLPQLEELEIIHADFSKDVIETFGQFCPQLKSCRLNCVTYNKIGIEFDGVALAIAENMPELRHLNLFGNKQMDDDGLGAILDGCPHLESLDLRRCYDLNFSGDLETRCRNIKVLKLPNDPIDEFEYDSSNYSSYDEYNSYDSSIYDDEGYESYDYAIHIISVSER